MLNLPHSLLNKLEQRARTNSLRVLPDPAGLIDFSSNDYLGFSGSAAIFNNAHQYLLDRNMLQNGATGSRLISGNHTFYKEAEDCIASFHEAEALIFNSGYDANVGLFSSVSQKGDVVLYDEYIHASIRDGIRLSNAKAYKFRHNDLNSLESLIKNHTVGSNEVYVVTESVFSMDGDSPNLQMMAEICATYKCRLIVDEAHALGVFGSKGEGLVQSLGLHNDVFARVVTFGKGLGCHGAAVLGSQGLKQYLTNFARSFIYTTGLPPHSIATVIAAYAHLGNAAGEREKLHENSNFFRFEADRLGLNQNFIPSFSAIHCAKVADNANAKAAAAMLQQNGFDVRAILAPTVPQGQERLRFCLHSFTTMQEITKVLELFKSFLLP